MDGFCDSCAFFRLNHPYFNLKVRIKCTALRLKKGGAAPKGQPAFAGSMSGLSPARRHLRHSF